MIRVGVVEKEVYVSDDGLGVRVLGIRYRGWGLGFRV